MEVDVIKRRSAFVASIKTYSKRRTEQPSRKRRRLSDHSVSAIKTLESLDRLQGSTRRNDRCTEKSDVVTDRLQDNGVQHTSKKRRVQDTAPSATRSEGSIKIPQSTAQQEDDSDPIHLPAVIAEHKQSSIHLISQHNTPQNPQQLTTKSTTPPLQAEDSIEPSQTIKIKKDSIRNYFKPVQASSTFVPTTSSSSPDSRQSTYSDSQELPHTPSSSPPPSTQSPVEFQWKSQRRARRRLTTKPLLPPVNIGPSNSKPAKDTKMDNSGSHQGSSPSDTPPSKRYKTTGDGMVQLKLAHTSTMEQCTLCSMPYDRAILSDKKAHEAFCKSFTGGSPPKDDSEVCVHKSTRANQEHAIMVIDRESTHYWRSHARWALRSSLDGLGGIDIDKNTLWSEFDHRELHEVPRYKVYLYTIDSLFVAVILAESIDYAGQYGIEADFKEWVSLCHQFPVYVSIDRIWVHSAHRHQGIATNLVDAVRKTFVSGIEVRKEEMAFSVPTEAGSFFATAYCRGTNFNSNPEINFLVNPADVPYHKQVSLKTNEVEIVENGRLLRDSRFIF